MLAKIYGYAESGSDVETLQNYAGVDIIAEDMEAREISALDASRKLKMSRSTFYRMVKRYRQSEKGGGDVCLS